MVRPHNARVRKTARKTLRPRQMSQKAIRRPRIQGARKTVPNPQNSDSDASDGSYIFLYQQNNPPSPPPQRQQPQQQPQQQHRRNHHQPRQQQHQHRQQQPQQQPQHHQPPQPPQPPQPQQQGGGNRRRLRAPQRIETPAQWQIRRGEGAFGNIPLAPFFRLVKEIMERVVREMNLDTTNYKIQSAALAAIRLAAEMYMVNFFEDVNLLAQHAKRVTIKPTDIKILMKLRAHQGDNVALSIPKYH